MVLSEEGLCTFSLRQTSVICLLPRSFNFTFKIYCILENAVKGKLCEQKQEMFSAKIFLCWYLDLIIQPYY